MSVGYKCQIELEWEEVGATGEGMNVIHGPELRTRAKLLSIKIYKDF